MDEDVKQLKKLAQSGLSGVYRKDYFVMAENNFIKNPNYTINQKMVYLCLQTYAGASASCFPSRESISKDLKISIRTVADALKDLKKIGALLIINQITDTNRKTSNLYILAEVDKHTGMFVPESLEKYKCLSSKSIKVKGK